MGQQFKSMFMSPFPPVGQHRYSTSCHATPRNSVLEIVGCEPCRVPWTLKMRICARDIVAIAFDIHIYIYLLYYIIFGNTCSEIGIHGNHVATCGLPSSLGSMFGRNSSHSWDIPCTKASEIPDGCIRFLATLIWQIGSCLGLEVTYAINRNLNMYKVLIESLLDIHVALQFLDFIWFHSISMFALREHLCKHDKHI
jgi:hypothetical protein